MGLVTTANLKARIGVAGSAEDTLLAAIITGVSARMARECGRVTHAGIACLEKTTGITEVHDVLDRHTETLWVRAYPIISVTSVKEGYYGVFGDDALAGDGDDYFVDAERGALHRVGSWQFGLRSVQVVYAGGYTSAGDDVGDGETALPADLVEAAYQQCGYLYERRGQIGATGLGVQGGSVQWSAAYGLLPDVRAVCEQYRRSVL